MFVFSVNDVTVKLNLINCFPQDDVPTKENHNSLEDAHSQVDEAKESECSAVTWAENIFKLPCVFPWSHWEWFWYTNSTDDDGSISSTPFMCTTTCSRQDAIKQKQRENR